MANALTNPRIVSDTALGFDWQAAEDEAVPGTPYAPKQFITAQNITINRNPSYIKPDGTHGSMHRRFEGTRITHQAEQMEIQFFGSKYNTMPFLESVTSGQPTVSDANITESGDTGGALSGYTLTGVRPYHNVQGFQASPVLEAALFLEVIETGGPASGFPIDIKAYTDVGKTNKVAEVLAVGGAGAVTLAAVSSSGLTVDCTVAAADTVDITLTIDKIDYSFANQYTRFFRLYYSDGQETLVFSNCVVQSLNFESSEEGELLVTAVVLGKIVTHTAAESLTVPKNALDLRAMAHADFLVTRDPSGTPTNPIVDSFNLMIENDVLQYIANQVSPQKNIKRGFTNIGGNMTGEMSDEFQTIIGDARSNGSIGVGFADFEFKWGHSNKFCTFLGKNVRALLNQPGVEGELVGKASIDYECHADGTNEPLSTISIEI